MVTMDWFKSIPLAGPLAGYLFNDDNKTIIVKSYNLTVLCAQRRNIKRWKTMINEGIIDQVEYIKQNHSIINSELGGDHEIFFAQHCPIYADTQSERIAYLDIIIKNMKPKTLFLISGPHYNRIKKYSFKNINLSS